MNTTNQNTANDARNWRDSKIPQWIKDQIQQELISSSLRWPLEPKPQPLPFGYASYSRMVGVVEPGIYWHIRMGFPANFKVELVGGSDSRFPTFVFNRHPDVEGSAFNHEKVLGPWFTNERDARLYMLWERCEEMAKELYKLTENLRTASTETA